jgi:hypothetical protein
MEGGWAAGRTPSHAVSIPSSKARGSIDTASWCECCATLPFAPRKAMQRCMPTWWRPETKQSSLCYVTEEERGFRSRLLLVRALCTITASKTEQEKQNKILKRLCHFRPRRHSPRAAATRESILLIACYEHVETKCNNALPTPHVSRGVYDDAHLYRALPRGCLVRAKVLRLHDIQANNNQKVYAHVGTRAGKRGASRRHDEAP